jgi:predicted RNA-binding protein (virulence factor B family)
MALKVGMLNTLEVARETDISYMLTDGIEEVFLHKRECENPLEIGEQVEVFLYFDNQKRVTATTKDPYVDTVNAAFCDVVDVNPRLGAFLNIGTSKDLLLSRDDLPFKKSEWPKIGAKVFVKMKVSKNQMTAKIIPRYEIMNYLKPHTDLIEGECYEAYVIYFAEEGIVLSTLEGHNIFVYHKHLRKEYTLGELVKVRIINVKTNYQYNGTLIKQKELLITDDAVIIKEYLEKHNGVMEITDKSDPKVIFDTFKMSKSAFKRAIGSLYKEKIITLEADSIHLNRD